MAQMFDLDNPSNDKTVHLMGYGKKVNSMLTHLRSYPGYAALVQHV